MSEPVRRLELFTGAGRRRRWSDEEKAAIVAESEAPDISVCAVARRHGLSVSQLFTWRRLARQADMDPQPALRFVPAVLAPDRQLAGGGMATQAGSPGEVHVGSPADPGPFAGIEVEVAGATVRIGAVASEAAIAAVIRALKASA